jgi:O-antigen/teichoic acid export membrane protein
MITKLKSLQNHQGFMKYFKNTSWLFGEKILRMVVGLFVGIWVARYLGPEQFGLFSYAQSLVGLFLALSVLGLDTIVIRELVDKKLKENELIGTAFYMKLMGAAIVFVILLIAINIMNANSIEKNMILIIAFSTVFQSFNVIDMYFQSKVMSKFVVFSNSIMLFIGSIIKVLLIINEASLIYFAWAVLLDSLILTIGLIYFYSKHKIHKIKEYKFQFKIAKSLIYESWPIIIAGFASMINMKLGVILLGNMTNFETVGNYSAALKISELWFMIPALLGSSIYPAIISAKKVSYDFYRNRILTTVKLMLIFAIPFAITVSLLASFIVSFLYGNKFQDAEYYLAIHIWSGLPYVVLFAYSQVTYIEKITIVHLYTAFATILINVLLNFILIPLYGGFGAAITSLVSAVIVSFFSIYLIEKKIKIFTYNIKKDNNV